MNTEWEIDLDYNRAIAQARKLEEVASQLEGSVVKAMAEMAEELSGAWKGSSGRLYISKVTGRQEELKTTAGKIRKIAKTIREEAREIRNQEKMALRK